ncbi:MAG: acVLRF1 family peptidyl-tRNA hydrolase [Streptosporangiaceae bacterium]
MANGPDGARWIDVDPERLAGWLESFEQRHGAGSADASPDAVTFRAADGAVAECHVPFPPLADAHAEGHADSVTRQAATPSRAEWGERMAAHARAERVVAVFLVRLGGYAAGVFTGPVPRLAASKVGSRLVHGRSAAGGTSQHRFARRREKQSAEALGAAAATAAAVFGPYAGRIDALVLGGDRRAMAVLRDDPRLTPYLGLAVERFLTVPDPRLTVLRSAPRLFRAIRIRLTGPA